MPDPDPQPPKPRAVSPARWLLMLLPSVLAIGAPFIAWGADVAHIHRRVGFDVTVEMLCLYLALPLSFFLGYRLEKWWHGEKWDGLRVFGYGFMILIVNGFISFAGCTIIFRPF